MLELTATSEVPFRAADVYRLMRSWNAPGTEMTVRAYVYAGTLEFMGGRMVAVTRVGRGLFQLGNPAEARRTLLQNVPEWAELLCAPAAPC